MNQLGLFETEELKQCRVESRTTVRLGKKSAQIPLAKKNSEALVRLKEILTQLEGKDILVGQYCDYWWYRNLRLNRLKVQWGSFFTDPKRPSVIVLEGNRGTEIRILWPNRLYQVREQYYGNGKPYYLLDFWNGFWQSPLSLYQRYYDCLHIRAVS